jgi:hypothetical protein
MFFVSKRGYVDTQRRRMSVRSCDKDINAIHQKMVDSVKGFQTKKTTVEELRKDMISALQTSFKDLIDLETENMRKLVNEFKSEIVVNQEAKASEPVTVEPTVIFEESTKDETVSETLFVKKI